MRKTRLFAAVLAAIGVVIAVAIPAYAAELPARVELNPAEEYALAQYCAAQTEGEPFVCQLAVAAAMLNRLNDPRFPHTVSGILTDAGYKAAPVKEADLSSARWAVNVAAMGMDPTGGSVYWAWADTADAAGITPRLTVGKRVFGVRE